MPGKDGFAVIEALRHNPGPNSRIPIIGVSAYAPELLDQERAGLFEDYLMKPVRSETLRSALARAVKQPSSLDSTNR
jgi:CheY-like chemotaxis protein